MDYQASVESFNEAFIVKNGVRHKPGKRFKLFPYDTDSRGAETVMCLQKIAGRYLCQIRGIEPAPISADELIRKLRADSDITIQSGEEIFDQVVRHMFFDKEGNIIPNNLVMIEHIPCEDSDECRLADYLVDVLGDPERLKSSIVKAETSVDRQNNALERCVISVISKSAQKPSLQKGGQKYQRITNVVVRPFEEDFDYILSARSRTRDYLIPLLEFYYFIYTAQTALQLDRFLEGERDKCVPLYFCLEWEKTSQSRKCFTNGWNLLQDAASRMFAHAVVLEILNQTGDKQTGNHDVPVDYIKLRELIDDKTIVGKTVVDKTRDQQIAEQIKELTDRYREVIDCEEMKALRRVGDPVDKTAAEVKFLFDSVKRQFEMSVRKAAYNRYSSKFTDYCEKYLKKRGRSGNMLNLSEEMLIFLTKVCIKDEGKMRLNDVFAAFERRGVFLDHHSKNEVMRYYEKMNLIEKKSDSGDAQYVKRIL